MSQNMLFNSSSVPLQQQTNSASIAPITAMTPAHPSPLASAQSEALQGIDMSALQGISPQQLALIAHLLQTGQLPLPPPPPTTATARNTSHVSQLQPQAFQLPAKLPNTHVDQNTNIDQEEGELEEGELGGDNARVRDFLSTPPKGPRIRSGSPRSRLSGEQDLKRNSKQSPRGQNTEIAAPPARSSGMNDRMLHSNDSHHSVKLPSRDASLKAFIIEMHKAGFTFDHVAKEVTSVSSLKRLYQQLGVPLSSSEKGVTTHSTQSTSLPSQEQSKANTKKSALPKAPASQDRSAYLAKLQAAKNKKSESAAATPPKATEPELRDSRASKPPLPATAPTPAVQTSNPINVAKHFKDKNEIIKQKLEALRAQQAAKLNATKLASTNKDIPKPERVVIVPGPHTQQNDDVKPGPPGLLVDSIVSETAAKPLQSSSNLQSPAQNSSENLLAARSGSSPVHPGVAASASPVLDRGSGLPGLFTTLSTMIPGAKQSSNAVSPAPSPLTASNGTQHPSLSSDRNKQHSVQASIPSLPLPPRPAHIQAYGAGAYQHLYWPLKPEERFVITESDEESGEDMDIDDSDQEPDVSSKETSKPASSQLVGADSTSTTSASPGGALKRNLQDMGIEEMRRYIAKHEQKRQKTNTSHAKADQSDAEANEARTSLDSSGSGNVTPLTGSATPDGQFASSNATSRKQEIQALRLRMEAAARNLAVQRQGQGSSIPNTSGSGPADTVESLSRAVKSPAADYPIDSDVPIGNTEAVELAQASSSEDDEDEAMYADPVSNNRSNAKHAPGKKDDDSKNSSQVSRQPYIHGNATNGLLSSSKVLEVRSPGHSEPAASSWSDTEEALYQSNPVPLTKEMQEPGPSVVDHTDNQAEDVLEEDDDLDDLYEPAIPAVQPNIITSRASASSASDEDEEHEHGDNTEIDENRLRVGDDDSDADDDDDSDDDDEEEEEDEEDEDEDEDGEDDGDSSEDDMDLSTDSEPDLENRPQEELVQTSGSSSSHSSSFNPSAYQPSANQEQTNGAPSSGDRLAPGLQPSREELIAPHEEPPKSRFFQTYESPLAKFKDYRYHSDYLNSVSGGFKSLTYCHQIDPDTPVCPWEAAGGACYDKTCQCQHFRSMGLSDNDLLRSIGTEKTPAHTAEEDKRWKSGLHGVVQELRTSNQSKDVLAIAHRIVDYRREFRGDPTKTLLLD